MRDTTVLKVFAEWDNDAEVWVAQSDDVPGLVAEAATIDALVAKLKVLVPEMLDENGYSDRHSGDIPFDLEAKCRVVASHTH
jgi:predicted RNase H-like HicB family nuclease